MEFIDLLEEMIKQGSGDLHLQSGSPPALRIGGDLIPMDQPPLSDDTLREWMRQVSSEQAAVTLDEKGEVDFSFEMSDKARWRVNAYRQRGRLAMALRLIPLTIPVFDELNLPHVLQEIAQTPRGLILVTGTTGSGKTTTLAAMIGYINANRKDRIITIEDPIEFVHPSKKSLIAQRELGGDTRTFAAALRVALRQDPDVLLVGELRDIETTRTALQAADTGHVVFSTVHTTNVAHTVQRVIALFPPEERELLILQLAENLEAIISQRLARTTDGKNRIPVVEIMRSSPTIRKLLRECEWSSLPKAMMSQEQGMQTFDQHLAKLWKAEIIAGREALQLATNAEALAMIMRGVSTKDLESGLV